MVDKNAMQLPCIGIWTLTETSLPAAGNTLVGLWMRGHIQRIGFFCAYYRHADGDTVNPDEEGWDYTTYHCRQGDGWKDRDPEIDAPDYWAEARWLIPDWREVSDA